MRHNLSQPKTKKHYWMSWNGKHVTAHAKCTSCGLERIFPQKPDDSGHKTAQYYINGIKYENISCL